MEFLQAVKVVFYKKYATFSGRASRSELLWSALFLFVAFFIWEGIFICLGWKVDAYRNSDDYAYFLIVSLCVFLIITFFPSCSVTVRRLHDINLSGRWILIPCSLFGFSLFTSRVTWFALLASLILGLLCLLEGKKSDNRFGRSLQVTPCIVSFSEAIKTVLWRKYATFSGRASRSEYWWFLLFAVVVSFIWKIGIEFSFANPLDLLMLRKTSAFLRFWDLSFSKLVIMKPYLFMVSLFDTIVSLFLFIPYMAVMIRRFHDVNLSGYWCFPFFCIDVLIYWEPEIFFAFGLSHSFLLILALFYMISQIICCLRGI